MCIIIRVLLWRLPKVEAQCYLTILIINEQKCIPVPHRFSYVNVKVAGIQKLMSIFKCQAAAIVNNDSFSVFVVYGRVANPCKYVLSMAVMS